MLKLLYMTIQAFNLLIKFLICTYSVCFYSYIYIYIYIYIYNQNVFIFLSGLFFLNILWLLKQWIYNYTTTTLYSVLSTYLILPVIYYIYLFTYLYI